MITEEIESPVETADFIPQEAQQGVFALLGLHGARAGVAKLGFIPSLELEMLMVLQVCRKLVPWHQKGLHE